MLRPASLLLLACVAMACDRDASPQRNDDAYAAPSESAPSPDQDADAQGGITMRYGCEQGHAVAIVHGDTARVTLADGRVIDIPRIESSAPPRYSGEALSFEIGTSGATLGQHEVGGFACREDG